MSDTGKPTGTTPAPTSEEKGDGLAGLGKWLAAGFTFVTTTLAAVGIAAGDVERVLRNSPAEALLWFSLVGVGIAAGLLVGYGTKGSDRQFRGWNLALVVLGIGVGSAVLFWQRIADAAELARTPSAWVAGAAAVLLVAGFLRAVWPPSISLRALVLSVGFLAFLGGVMGVFHLGVENTSAKDRPTVTASVTTGPDGRTELSAQIEASGLRADEHVFVIVEGLSSRGRLSGARAGRPGREGAATQQFGTDAVQALYVSSTGPDRDGSVSLPVSIEVSPGLYDRIRVHAFLETPRPDPLAQWGLLQRRGEMEMARREQYDLDRGVYRLDDEERERRERYDAASGGVLDDEERERRARMEQALYEERVDEEERERRGEFDHQYDEDEAALRDQLEQESLQDIRCNPGARTRGCVILLLPEAENRPAITAAPSLDDGVWSLGISVRSTGLSADDAILLRVYTRLSSESVYAAPFYEASLAPAAGGIDRELVLPLTDAGLQAVCVTGQVVRDARGQPQETYAPTDACLSTEHRVSAVQVVLPEEAGP